MPKLVPAEELRTIEKLVSSFPEGIQVGTIRQKLPFTLPTRMLQRRLKHLCDQGQINSRGSGKGKSYYPATPFMMKEQAAQFEPMPATGEINLSAKAEEIKALIQQPLFQRTSVGYIPEFLQNYRPNQSYYLPTEVREELANIGHVGPSHLPAGTHLRKVMDRLLIDLSWNSSRLEGNTYSLLETQRLFELGESAEGKTTEDTQMILNHKAAIEMLADQAGEIGFNRYTVCNLHAILSDNLLPDLSSCGRIRDVGVGIGGSVYRPLGVPQQIEEYFLEILSKATLIANPFEQAFFTMVHLPYLQPFEDVNKRVSRLVANIPMVIHNLCPLSFIDVPQRDYVSGLLGVYELNRVDYLRDVFVWAYRRSASRYAAIVQSIGQPDPFRLKYRVPIKNLVRGIVEQVLDKKQAAKNIAQFAATDIPETQRARFIEAVETELISLHEGNIARFQLRPSSFQKWQPYWR